MKNFRTPFALVALAALALANDGAGEKPGFGPKAGTTLTKNFVIEGEMEMEDMTLEVDGQDMSEMAQLQMVMKNSLKVSVTDRYEAVSGGRPAKLVRTFDELSANTHMAGNNPMTGEEEKDIPQESELQGAAVVFSWSEDDSDYQVAFEGDQKGDESLLEDLQEDMDLRGFLPTSEVAEGDTWAIPAEAVRAALVPGGDVKLRPSESEGGGDPMSGADQFSQNDMIGELGGTFEATYAGTREEEGTRVAVIKLKLEAESATDMAERLEEMKEEMKNNLPEGMEIDVSTMDIEFELEAEGELLWNVEAGLVFGLHLSGEMGLIVDMSMTMKMGGQEPAMDMSQTYKGNQTITLTTSD